MPTFSSPNLIGLFALLLFCAVCFAAEPNTASAKELEVVQIAKHVFDKYAVKSSDQSEFASLSMSNFTAAYTEALSRLGYPSNRQFPWHYARFLLWVQPHLFTEAVEYGVAEAKRSENEREKLTINATTLLLHQPKQTATV